MKKTMLVGAIIGLMISCGSPAEDLGYEPNKYDSLAIELGEKNGWETERLESGLHIFKEVEGSAEKPKVSDFVTLSLKGYLMNGEKFADSDGQPIMVRISDFQEAGMKEGLRQFGKGGKGVLLMPPSLAYGEEGIGPIPPNAMIYFEVELADFSANPPPPPAQVDYTPQIEAYISEKGLDAKPTGSGMYVVIEEPGGELKPTVSQSVSISYKVYGLDGTVFQSTEGEAVSFGLGGLILGWQEGIPYFGKGGKGKLIIPPYLAYGDRASGPIPAKSILVFDIELFDFSGPTLNQ